MDEIRTFHSYDYLLDGITSVTSYSDYRISSAEPVRESVFRAPRTAPAHAVPRNTVRVPSRPVVRPAEEEWVRENETEDFVPNRHVAVGRGISVFSALGFALCALIVFTFLSAKVRVTELSSSAVQITAQITELQREQSALLSAYESAFNYSRLEEAAAELGMTKPRADQKFSLTLPVSEDRIVLLDSPASRGLYDRVNDFLDSIVLAMN